MWCIQSIQSIAAAGRKAIKQFLSSILRSLCSFSHFHFFANVSPPVFVLMCAWQWKTVLNKSGIWKKNGLSLLWNTLASDALPSVQNYLRQSTTSCKKGFEYQQSWDVNFLHSRLNNPTKLAFIFWARKLSFLFRKSFFSNKKFLQFNSSTRSFFLHTFFPLLSCHPF